MCKINDFEQKTGLEVSGIQTEFYYATFETGDVFSKYISTKIAIKNPYEDGDN